MSRWSDERDRAQHFRADVAYQVWRSGGNPDAVNGDRLFNDFYEGRSVDDCVRAEMRRQHDRRNAHQRDMAMEDERLRAEEAAAMEAESEPPDPLVEAITEVREGWSDYSI